MARVERITVLVNEEVKENFHRIAHNFGMTESALGAFAIGKFVHSIMQSDQPVLEYGGDCDQDLE